MDETLRQLGELLLSSVPTIIALLIVWSAYRLIVHTRLQQVLAERHTRTEGAIEQAKLEISNAETRTAEYEQRVREARSAIYKQQEARRQRMIEARNTALAQARSQAEVMIANARTALEKDVAAARVVLQEQAQPLADKIIDSVLRTALAVGGR
ncbi:MAG TPA: ATP synthase F0 subunit B [Candidatus Angelobacter sp.]|nr:ATP synthase F0 subunit B [Candidatus Angelobacter sp.]